MKKISINYLYIEVTRRCTMKCAHCLRGDSQNISLKIDHIDELFDNSDIQINKINNLIITGGEPTLNIKAILQIIKNIISKQIVVGNLHLPTNGSTYSQQLIDGLNEYYNYIKKYNATSNLYLICSQDQFHRPPKKEILDKYKKLPYFISNYIHLEENQILNLGKAYENNLGNKETNYEMFLYFDMYLNSNYPKVYQDSSDNYFINELYLSSKGLYSFHIVDMPFQQIDELCIYNNEKMVKMIEKNKKEKIIKIS